MVRSAVSAAGTGSAGRCSTRSAVKHVRRDRSGRLHELRRRIADLIENYRPAGDRDAPAGVAAVSVQLQAFRRPGQEVS
jgi:hypothetical protein